MALIRNILSPELQQKVEDDRRETERLFGLAPRWLARRLLVTARSIRQRSEKWMSHDVVYDAKLLWHLVPEVAYRLSERRFTTDERSDFEVRQMTDQELRFATLHAWRNSVHRDGDLGSRMFFREMANGNLVAMALDHLVAPTDGDWASARIKEVARHRGVEKHDGKWSPAMNRR